MKYYVESGLKIPTFTKGWKLGRFITGMVFGIFSIWPTSHFALRYTWLGAAVNLILFALSFNV